MERKSSAVLKQSVVRGKELGNEEESVLWWRVGVGPRPRFLGAGASDSEEDPEGFIPVAGLRTECRFLVQAGTLGLHAQGATLKSSQ